MRKKRPQNDTSPHICFLYIPTLFLTYRSSPLIGLLPLLAPLKVICSCKMPASFFFLNLAFSNSLTLQCGCAWHIHPHTPRACLPPHTSPHTPDTHYIQIQPTHCICIHTTYTDTHILYMHTPTHHIYPTAQTLYAHTPYIVLYIHTHHIHTHTLKDTPLLHTPHTHHHHTHPTYPTYKHPTNTHTMYTHTTLTPTTFTHKGQLRRPSVPSLQGLPRVLSRVTSVCHACS